MILHSGSKIIDIICSFQNFRNFQASFPDILDIFGLLRGSFLKMGRIPAQMAASRPFSFEMHRIPPHPGPQHGPCAERSSAHEVHMA